VNQKFYKRKVNMQKIAVNRDAVNQLITLAINNNQIKLAKEIINALEEAQSVSTPEVVTRGKRGPKPKVRVISDTLPINRGRKKVPGAHIGSLLNASMSAGDNSCELAVS
jgi:hypothetical protein